MQGGTSVTAIDVLKEIQKNLTDGQVGTIGEINPAYLQEKAAQLSAHYPFDELASKWLPLGLMGGGRFNHDGFMHTMWAMRRLLQGASPDDVARAATISLNENSESFFEISDVMGITVSDITKIDDDVWLYPNALLPPSQYNDHVFAERWILGNLGRSDTAALVRSFRLTPVYYDSADKAGIARRQAESLKIGEAHLKFKHLLRRALILEGDGPVEIVSSYLTNSGDSIIDANSGMHSSYNTATILQNRNPDIPVVLELIDALRLFRTPLPLELAIDRLGRSRGEIYAVNKAIDLGMSLEIALMHDDKNAKEEINAKLGLRAGWLLGESPQSRGAYKKETTTLYSARSDAVHNGKVDEKKFDPAKADALVKEVLVAILRRGEFPDWNDLTFGGSGNPTV